MNAAKLRRSRDVSPPQRSKIKKGFRIRDLAMLNMAFCVASHREKLARQAADLIAKLLISDGRRPSERTHISSGKGRHSLPCQRGIHAVTVLSFPIQPQPSKQPRRPRKPTKRISLRQARSMMEGLDFAREIGLSLNTHLIIHWGGTLAGDDPEGDLFAKFRYLLDKRFRRKFGLELTAIWVRERHRNRHTRQSSEVTHSHLLLHLPSQHRKVAEQDVEELVALVATQILDDRTIELTFPSNPDGKYFLKGGTPGVWDAFGLPHKWRSKLGEGWIEGKRCGATQNIGPAARQRWHNRLN